MKVKQVVGEHKKGFRAKKYASKPKKYIEPVKPTSTATKPQGVAEGDDPLQNRADYAKKHGQGQVYKKTYPGDKVGMTKAYAYDVKRTGPKGQLPKEDMDLDETTPIGVVSAVSPDGKQVTIKKSDGTELKTTGDAVLPGPDGKTASLAPGAGNELKPGTPVTSSAEQSVSEEPNEDISAFGLTQHDNGDTSYNAGPMSIRKSKDGSTDAQYDLGMGKVRMQQNPVGVKTISATGDIADQVVGVDASAQRLGVDPAKVRPYMAREAKELEDMLRIAGLK